MPLYTKWNFQKFKGGRVQKMEIYVIGYNFTLIIVWMMTQFFPADSGKMIYWKIRFTQKFKFYPTLILSLDICRKIMDNVGGGLISYWESVAKIPTFLHFLRFEINLLRKELNIT